MAQSDRPRRYHIQNDMETEALPEMLYDQLAESETVPHGVCPPNRR